MDTQTLTPEQLARRAGRDKRPLRPDVQLQTHIGPPCFCGSTAFAYGCTSQGNMWLQCIECRVVDFLRPEALPGTVEEFLAVHRRAFDKGTLHNLKLADDAPRNTYEWHQTARRDRLEARAERATEESNARFQRAHDILAPIPFGQPILVGHHSEGRHRRALARHDSNMRAGFDAAKRAETLTRRAVAVGSGGVSSDDPDAIDKLRAELALLVERQAQMKRVNELWRKFKRNPAALDESTDLSEKFKEQIRNFKPEWSGDKPMPAYALSNNNANIRRIERRVKELAERQAVAASCEKQEFEFQGFKVVQNFAENRTQLFFDRKPTKEQRGVFKVLRSRGFIFSRSAGNAWQRKLSSDALHLVTEGSIRQEIETILQSEREEQ